MLTATDTAHVLSLLEIARNTLNRIEAILAPEHRDEDELAQLNPGSPLNKSDKFLTHRGIEVCYRLFDLGKSRYEVAQLLSISFGAATHRFNSWEKLGGKDRERKPLDQV